jgi:hypothetical protein
MSDNIEKHSGVDLDRRIGFPGELRIDPIQTSIRKGRGDEPGVVAKLEARYGETQVGQFWGRAYTSKTDDGRDTLRIDSDDLRKMSLVGLPVYIEHCYPRGEKIPRDAANTKKLYTIPGRGSSPIGRVVVSDSDVAPGDIWVLVELDTSGISPERERAFRMNLHGGQISGLSVCFAHGKTIDELPRGGSGARFVCKDGTIVEFEELSLVTIPDISGCGPFLIKAGSEQSAETFDSISHMAEQQQQSTAAPSASAATATTTAAATSTPSAPQSSAPQSTEQPKSQQQQQQPQSDRAKAERMAQQHLEAALSGSAASPTPPAPAVSTTSTTSAAQELPQKQQQQQPQQQQPPSQQQQQPKEDQSAADMRAEMRALQAEVAKMREASEASQRRELETRHSAYTKEYSERLGVPADQAKYIVENSSPQVLEKMMETLRAAQNRGGSSTRQSDAPMQQQQPQQQQQQPQRGRTSAADPTARLFRAPQATAGAAPDDVVSAPPVRLIPGMKADQLDPVTQAVVEKMDSHPASLLRDPMFLNRFHNMMIANSS